MKNNNQSKRLILLLVVTMTLFSCDLFNLNWGRNKYTIGHFPTSPVNLEEFNLDVFPFCFSSNRNSNGANYDISYSFFENGNWSEPVNFGEDINSEYDEYRPIVRSKPWEFDNDMMIFSSNRPGGKGGFDLYFVGIERKGEI